MMNSLTTKILPHMRAQQNQSTFSRNSINSIICKNPKRLLSIKASDTKEQQLEKIRAKEGFIIDMDGVLWHANHILPGVDKFLNWIQASNKKFIFLTNASDITQQNLTKKMERLTGMKFTPDHFYTATLATTSFLARQTPNGRAFVVGSPALVEALEDVGYTIAENDVDYVVIGEGRAYNFEHIEKAVSLIRKGARLIGTNCDIMDRVGSEVVPSVGALIAPIEIMTQRKAYYVGKPNPLIMNYAMNVLQTTRDKTVIIGDRMDTDIIAGLELGIDSTLVLSGVTSVNDLKNFGYKPSVILDGVGHILD